MPQLLSKGVMNEVFNKFIRKFLLVYLDDILTFLKSEKEHAQHFKASTPSSKREFFLCQNG
jgi:hypothetical protein